MPGPLAKGGGGDAATGAWENVSISVVSSTFGGVACGGGSVTAIRNVTLALSGCGLAQDVAPLSAMNLTAGAAALSGSGISVHVVDSNLAWANPAGPVALLQLASFAKLDGVLLTVVASAVSVVSNASASVVRNARHRPERLSAAAAVRRCSLLGAR